VGNVCFSGHVGEVVAESLVFLPDHLHFSDWLVLGILLFVTDVKDLLVELADRGPESLKSPGVFDLARVYQL